MHIYITLTPFVPFMGAIFSLRVCATAPGPLGRRREKSGLTMHSPGCAGKKINCRRQAAKYRRSKKRRKRKGGKKKKTTEGPIWCAPPLPNLIGAPKAAAASHDRKIECPRTKKPAYIDASHGDRRPVVCWLEKNKNKTQLSIPTPKYLQIFDFWNFVLLTWKIDNKYHNIHTLLWQQI